MLPAPASPMVARQPDEEIQTVQGIMPDSINEWYVSLAMDKLELDYTFQFVMNGGTNLRGGQVIDFLVWKNGGIPVFIQGAYWHKITTEMEDILKQAEAEHRFGNKPVLLMEDETNTKDKAYRAVIEKVM